MLNKICVQCGLLFDPLTEKEFKKMVKHYERAHGKPWNLFTTLIICEKCHNKIAPLYWQHYHQDKVKH